jgi:hypothetical protein
MTIHTIIKSNRILTQKSVSEADVGLNLLFEFFGGSHGQFNQLVHELAFNLFNGRSLVRDMF